MHKPQTPHAFTDGELTTLARAFADLAAMTRVRIILVLAKGESDVTSICAALELSQPIVSHNLAILRMCGFLVRRRAGHRMIYALDRARCPDGPGLRIAVNGIDVSVLSR